MKYIFLDIDGVLNSGQNAWKFIHNPELLPQYRFLGKGDWVEVELLNRLIELVKDEDAKIVGVSSWFTFIKDPKAELKEIEDVLMLPVYDVSHSTGGGVHRGHGVLSWLKEKGYDETRDSFVVLDDGGERYYGFPTVITNGRTGLTDDDIILAKEHLNNPLSLEECLSLQKDYKYKEV